jgi:hypothetical protein
MADGLLNKASIILTPTGYKAGTLYNVAPIDEPYEDFDFARASVASRVNSSGLVEMVGRTLGSELVQNGDFSELGSELVVNGDFATDSDWTLTQATISNGVASFATTDGSFAAIRQNVFTTGKTYLISLDVSDLVGTAEVNTNGGTSIGLDITTNGTKSFYMKAENTDIEIKRKFGQTNVSATIDNVSVKQVDPNDYWTLGTGWSIEDGKLVGDGVESNAFQSGVVQNGNTYKITLTAYNITTGYISVRIGSGGTENFQVNSNGTQSFYATADNGTFVLFRNQSGFDGSIDNVSVKEIIDTNNIPRISYDSNGDNGHILLEPTSTNILEYSEDFSQWILQDSASVSTESYTSPSGDNTAKLIDLSANSNARLVENFGNNSTTYTLSFYLKKHQDDSDGTFPIGYYNGTDYIKTYVNLIGKDLI